MHSSDVEIDDHLAALKVDGASIMAGDGYLHHLPIGVVDGYVLGLLELDVYVLIRLSSHGNRAQEGNATVSDKTWRCQVRVDQERHHASVDVGGSHTHVAQALQVLIKEPKNLAKAS